MAGILSRLTRGHKALTLADKHRLMLEAVDLFRQETPVPDIEEYLKKAGASNDEARAVAEQSRGKFEAELVRSVTLPDSARLDINYYFLLGVTPRATPERIHRSYRRKAKDVHPDRHAESEFTRDYWSRLMTLMTEAHDVLTDPTTRRVYDVVWRERSKKVAAENRRKGEVRGDWETRYRWEMAELVEMEDEIADLLDAIRQKVAEGEPLQELTQKLVEILDDYEAEALEIRTETHGLPPPFLHFGDTVRHEMQRKEHLVSGLQELCTWLIEPTSPEQQNAVLGLVATAERVIEEVRIAQHQFDIAALR